MKNIIQKNKPFYNIEHFDAWVGNNLEQFNNELIRIRFSNYDNLLELNKAIDYSILDVGKRYRPLLCMAAGELVNASKKTISLVAIAIEMIHIFSLIQDDLPSMDNDFLRHGKLSLHMKYSPSTALLVCDTLIAKAFEIISTLDLDANIKILLIQELSKAIGINGLSGGQYLDLNFNALNMSKKMLNQVHYMKTTRLIQASLKMGAICNLNMNYSSANLKVKKLEYYGFLIGKAYQIIDDVLDQYSTTQKLGKSIKKDLNNNKATYVSISGLNGSLKKISYLINKAKKVANNLDDGDIIFTGIAHRILSNFIEKVNFDERQ